MSPVDCRHIRRTVEHHSMFEILFLFFHAAGNLFTDEAKIQTSGSSQVILIQQGSGL